MYKNHELNVENKAKWYECYVFINKVVHRVYYKTTVDGMFHLYIDDKCIVSKKHWIVKLQGFDYAVEIDGETIHCVFIEKKLDVAMYGRYIKSQKNYIPNKVLSRCYTGQIIIILIMFIIVFLELTKVTDLPAIALFVIFGSLAAGIDVFGRYAMNYYKKAKEEQRLKWDTSGMQ